jgi:hypothetical protein
MWTPASYSNLGVRVVHCLLSSGSCRALSAKVSATSFRGSPRCILTLNMNVRAPRITLSRKHSMIVFMMSAFASHASVVRGPLPIHLDTLSKVVSLSHKYSRSVAAGVACSVRDTAASSGLSELTPSSSRSTLTSRCLSCCWRLSFETLEIYLQFVLAPFLLPGLFQALNHSIIVQDTVLVH